MIRSDQLTPDHVPVEHRIVGILKPLRRDPQILVTVEPSFGRLARDFCLGPVEPPGGGVELRRKLVVVDQPPCFRIFEPGIDRGKGRGKNKTPRCLR